MTRAINGWAIWKADCGLLLHSVAMSKMDAWAMLNFNHHPDEPMRSTEERERLGFVAVPIRIKYDEPEGRRP
jgi:hypothetical protein